MLYYINMQICSSIYSMTLCTDPVAVLLRSMEMQVSKYDLKMASRLQRYMKMILKPNKTKSH